MTTSIDSCRSCWMTHLCEQLVQCLLALVISADRVRAITLLTDGIDLIDEDDARCVLFCLLEEVTDLRCTHTYEHLDKFRARD